MKRILTVLLVALMLTGCQSSGDTLNYFVKEGKKYALVNDNGDIKSKFVYDKYEQLGSDGYLVKKGKEYQYIDLDGKTIIDGKKYTKMEILEKMIVAYDKDKKITLFDSDGDVIYKESKKLKIKISGLPIIYKNKKYIVLNGNGEDFKDSKNPIKYASVINENYYSVSYKDNIKLYSTSSASGTTDKTYTLKLKGGYMLKAYDSTLGFIFYNDNVQKYAYVNAKGKLISSRQLDVDTIEFKDASIIGQKGEDTYLISVEDKEPIKATSYYKNYTTYAFKSEYIYSGHKLITDGDDHELEDSQLNPQVTYTKGYIIPVYKRSKGYQYYNYNGKKAFKDTFISCEDFDTNNRAIVSKKEDQYYLINTKGTKITKTYKKIKYLDDQFYAVYKDSSTYQIIDKKGNIVIDDTFMGDGNVYVYQDQIYGIFDKSGTNYVYNMTNYDIILSKGKTLRFDDKQNCFYSKDRKIYYNIDGDVIYKRG